MITRRFFLTSAAALSLMAGWHISASAQTIPFFGDEPIFAAVKAGDIPKVRELIQRGVSPNRQDVRKFTPLFYAAERVDIEMMRYLVQSAGARPDEQDTVGNTALFYCADRGDYQSTEELLNLGAAADKPNRQGITPLMQALRQGYGDIAELLLDAGANPNGRDYAGNTVMDWTRRGRNPGLEPLLRKRGGTD